MNPGDKCNFVDNAKPQPITFSTDYIIIGLIIAIMFCCVCSVCYYRCRFEQDRAPPFPVPDWCPSCIFPRTYMDERDVKIETTPEKTHEMKEELKYI